ncbi:aminoglycoside phosphotransferase family protein [Nocardia cyriacigeorgica]|uniref:aminoglycoside phosphotransferase family protein n=1 Tax=Nocardia cyriacigeorgica TaxID=135487 RepID=UPI002458BDFC|nr:aminoglycoside phosphotransferase family protein [Nocardia cyriacigeorgica]
MDGDAVVLDGDAVVLDEDAVVLDGDAVVLGADAVGAGEDAVALGDDPAVRAADTRRSERTHALTAALTEIAFRTGASGAPEVLADRVDVLVIRVGEVVVKAHPADSDVSALRTRLRVADLPWLRSVLLAPVPVDGETLLSRTGRPITLWPSGSPVDPEAPDAAPWESAARLLATLHAAPVHGCRDLPAAGGPARVHRAMRRLHNAGHVVDATAAAVVRRAYDSLPELNCAPKALTHGDFHLGQLVRPADGAWRLIDLDDLGLGDPAWDLARPAAFFAAGILDPAAWTRFVTAYRAAGGPAIPPDGDIWPALDLPARAVVVQAAALAVASGRPLDDLDTALVDTCLRLTETPAPEPISSSVTP